MIRPNQVNLITANDDSDDRDSGDQGRQTLVAVKEQAETRRRPRHPSGRFVGIRAENEQKSVLEHDGQDKGENQGIHVIAVGGPDERPFDDQTRQKHQQHRQEHGGDNGDPESAGQQITEISGQR